MSLRLISVGTDEILELNMIGPERINLPPSAQCSEKTLPDGVTVDDLKVWYKDDGINKVQYTFSDGELAAWGKGAVKTELKAWGFSDDI